MSADCAAVAPLASRLLISFCLIEKHTSGLICWCSARVCRFARSSFFCLQGWRRCRWSCLCLWLVRRHWSRWPLFVGLTLYLWVCQSCGGCRGRLRIVCWCCSDCIRRFHWRRCWIGEKQLPCGTPLSMVKVVKGLDFQVTWKVWSFKKSLTQSSRRGGRI